MARYRDRNGDGILAKVVCWGRYMEKGREQGRLHKKIMEMEQKKDER
jgi:hypothetical protein